jgi:hypothetical protein
VGTQQFANGFFDGTVGRAQIGTRILVGAQERTSYGVAMGQSTPVVRFDPTIPGRGVYMDKTPDPGPEADYPWVREIQPAYITPRVAEFLSQAPPAPAWFDQGLMAPWITGEILKEMTETAAVANFLPGGKFGPVSLPGVTPVDGMGVRGGSPSSEGITGGAVTARITDAVTGAEPVDEIAEADALPRTYSLAEAFAEGIVPWKPGTVRVYKGRSEERGIPFPEGVTDGQAYYYTEEELRAWVAAYQAYGKS